MVAPPLPRARSAPACLYLAMASDDLECPCCDPAIASRDSPTDLSVLGVQALTRSAVSSAFAAIVVSASVSALAWSSVLEHLKNLVCDHIGF